MHGHVSRRMWAHLWPWRVEEEIPIGHITNGVHVPSWLAWQMLQLYDRNFPVDWMHRMGEPEVWQSIHNVDPGELWETHNALKNLLLAFVRRRVSRQCRRRGESDDVVEAARNLLDPERADDRLCPPVRHVQAGRPDPDRHRPAARAAQRPGAARCRSSSPARPIPADEPGKQLIKQIANLRHDPRFANRDRVRRGLRHQRLPAHDPGRRRVAEQSRAARWKPRAPAARRPCSTAA